MTYKQVIREIKWIVRTAFTMAVISVLGAMIIIKLFDGGVSLLRNNYVSMGYNLTCYIIAVIINEKGDKNGKENTISRTK